MATNGSTGERLARPVGRALGGAFMIAAGTGPDPAEHASAQRAPGEHALGEHVPDGHSGAGHSEAVDHISAELAYIKANVAGVQGSLAATSDGLVLAHDVPGLEPTQIAALAATTLALASRATLATGLGGFREAIARGDDGYLAVYSAGISAIVAVVGSSQLNLGMLRYQAGGVMERIAGHATGLKRIAPVIPPLTPPPPRTSDAPATRGQLPRRRAATPPTA
jgi:uncharacterized protein